MKIAEHLTKPISKILKFLLRRLVFVTVAIILQMIWMTYMVVVIGEYSKAIEWVFRIFSITVVIYIANKDDNPAYKLAWTIQSFFAGCLSPRTRYKNPPKIGNKRIGIYVKMKRSSF